MRITVARNERVYTTYDVPDEAMTSEMREALDETVESGDFMYADDRRIVKKIVDAIPFTAVVMSEDVESTMDTELAVLAPEGQV